MRGLPRFFWLVWGLLISMSVISTARAANESIAIALTVRGAAEVKQGVEEWIPLAFGAVLNDSDQVRTGENGFIALAFTDDGSQIKLRPNTSVTVTAVRSENLALSKKVAIQVGELLSEVKKQKGSMEVNTPTSVASVKGTEFWTMVDPSGGTTVITLEGLIELYNLVSGTSVQVPVGQYATSSASGRISARPMSPAIQVPTWNPEEQQPPQQPEEQQPQEEQQQPSAEPEGSGGGGGGGGGLGIGGAVGSTILEDGRNYQYISLRPDVSIWRFGIGLDLPLYFDPKGGIRNDEWDFKTIDDVVNKIFYLRYNKPGDRTYVRVGALQNITLGYGLIMRDYSNAIEWPKVRRPGVHFQQKIGAFGIEGMTNNLNELSPANGMQGPGVVGLRGTFEMKLGLPIIFGATAVYDGNQYLGIQDQDGDGVPNQFDIFEGDDKVKIEEARNQFLIPGTTELDTAAIRNLIAIGALKDILAPSMDFKNRKASAFVMGVDVGVPLIRREKMQLWLYGQAAQIADYGMGISAPGLKFRLGPVSLGAEYRIFGKEFMPEFFNYSYEIDRVAWVEGADSSYYMKKTSRLNSLKSASGYFVDAGIALGNLFNLYASYQAMDYGAGFPSKNLFGSASLNPKLVPKLGLAEAYYFQPNADKLFESTDGTVAGYRIGFEMGGGFMLVMDNKSIYRNGVWEKVMTVETQFKF
ncbi:MAG: FecR family protein [bacterium]